MARRGIAGPPSLRLSRVQVAPLDHTVRRRSGRDTCPLEALHPTTTALGKDVGVLVLLGPLPDLPGEARLPGLDRAGREARIEERELPNVRLHTFVLPVLLHQS